MLITYQRFITRVKRCIQRLYLASDSEVVIHHKQAQASTQQQLGNDDNKLPPRGTQTQCLKVDAGVKVAFVKCYKKTAATAAGFCDRANKEDAICIDHHVVSFCWAPEAMREVYLQLGEEETPKPGILIYHILQQKRAETISFIQVIINSFTLIITKLQHQGKKSMSNLTLTTGEKCVSEESRQYGMQMCAINAIHKDEISHQ